MVLDPLKVHIQQHNGDSDRIINFILGRYRNVRKSNSELVNHKTASNESPECQKMLFNYFTHGIWVVSFAWTSKVHACIQYRHGSSSSTDYLVRLQNCTEWNTTFTSRNTDVSRLNTFSISISTINTVLL